MTIAGYGRTHCKPCVKSLTNDYIIKVQNMSILIGPIRGFIMISFFSTLTVGTITGFQLVIFFFEISTFSLQLQGIKRNCSPYKCMLRSSFFTNMLSNFITSSNLCIITYQFSSVLFMHHLEPQPSI